MDVPGPPPELDEVSQAALALRGRRVLLVAADGFDRLVASELLQDGAGASVLVADGLAQAVDLLGGQSVDCVLLDLDSPGGPGPEAAVGRGGEQAGAEWVRRLRLQAPGAGHTPVVTMALPDDAGCAPGVQDGIAHCLAKPLHPAALFTAVAACLPAGRAAAQPAAAPDAAAGAPVSFALGLERCLGRHDLYVRVAQRFLEQGAQSVQGIGEALAQGDRKTAARLAHSMISTAGTLGALPLVEHARALYAALAEGEGDEAAPLVALAAESDRVRCALREHLGPATAPDT